MVASGLLVASLLAPPAWSSRRGEPTLPRAVRELRAATATRAVTKRLERSSRLGLTAFREFMSLRLVVSRLRRRRPSRVHLAVIGALEVKHEIEVGRRARRPTARAFRARVATVLGAHQRIIARHVANIHALATLLRLSDETHPSEAFKRAVGSLRERQRAAKALLKELRAFRRRLTR